MPACSAPRLDPGHAPLFQLGDDFVRDLLIGARPLGRAPHPQYHYTRSSHRDVSATGRREPLSRPAARRETCGCPLPPRHAQTNALNSRPVTQWSHVRTSGIFTSVRRQIAHSTRTSAILRAAKLTKLASAHPAPPGSGISALSPAPAWGRRLRLSSRTRTALFRGGTGGTRGTPRENARLKGNRQ